MSVPTYIYIYSGLILFVVIILLLVQYIIRRRYLRTQTFVLFELTPPRATRKSPIATEKFFTIIHAIMMQRSVNERLLGRHRTFSLEVVSSKELGIRYLACVATTEASSFRSTLTSYLPEVMCLEVDDYLTFPKKVEKQEYIKLTQFTQTQHYAYPLRGHDSLSQHDPIAYITGSMTQLLADERMSFQIVLAPREPREVHVITKLLARKQPLNLHQVTLPVALSSILSVVRAGLRMLFGMINSMIVSTYELPYQPSRALPNASSEILTNSVAQKISQPLFEVSLRIMVVSPNKARAMHRSDNLKAAFSVFDMYESQSLRARKGIAITFMPQRAVSQFTTRRLTSPLLQRTLLSVSEIAALYHFPYGLSRTENIVTSLSRSLPAPISLKNNPTLDVHIGENSYHGITTPIGLTAAERERHMYVIGGTGNGKTTMLQYMIMQDIHNGKGVAVIDPHGDMAQEIASRIPAYRIKDVVYFNPDDLSYPVGMNILELDASLEGDDLLREKDLITESVVSIFRKIFSNDDSGGHRIEYILRNATQTALTVADATLFTIYDLLNDGRYRRSIVTKLSDENLKNFWRTEFGSAGSFQQVKMSAGITAKVGRFLFSASAKRILEQPKSTINFDTIMDEGKILICNFSKGMIGEDTSELLGIAVLAKLQLASLRRARIRQSDRRPFYLYVDEFQNFATISFVQMLSESRKYKLFLTMAEQSTSQQADKDMVNIILANVGTIITFRTGNPADEKVLLPLFSPFIDHGEIMNLASYHFFIRLAAIHSQEPLSGETLLLGESGSNATLDRVITVSRRLNARLHSEATSVTLKTKPNSRRESRLAVGSDEEVC